MLQRISCGCVFNLQSENVKTKSHENKSRNDDKANRLEEQILGEIEQEIWGERLGETNMEIIFNIQS